MAAPILQSVFKPTDFDVFLDEIGYEDVKGQNRLALVDRMREAAEYEIVTRIFRKLTPDKKIEAYQVLKQANETGNDAELNDFLLREVPDIEGLVDEAVDKVKNDLRLSTGLLENTINTHLALLKHDLQAGEPRGAEEEFNPPSSISSYSPSESPTRPVPEPTGKDEEPQQNTSDEVDTQQTTENDSSLEPQGNAPAASLDDVMETLRVPTEVPDSPPPLVPPDSESKEALKDELDSLGSNRWSNPQP